MTIYNYTNRFDIGDKVQLLCDIRVKKQHMFDKPKERIITKGTQGLITYIKDRTSMHEFLQLCTYDIVLDNNDILNGIPETYLEKMGSN